MELCPHSRRAVKPPGIMRVHDSTTGRSTHFPDPKSRKNPNIRTDQPSKKTMSTQTPRTKVPHNIRQPQPSPTTPTHMKPITPLQTRPNTQNPDGSLNHQSPTDANPTSDTRHTPHHEHSTDTRHNTDTTHNRHRTPSTTFHVKPHTHTPQPPTTTPPPHPRQHT